MENHNKDNDNTKENINTSDINNTSEYTDTSDSMEHLYLGLVGTPGIFATIIKAVTRIKYIHIILGMDEEMKYAYSFGRRKPSIPILSGFEHEELDKVIKHFPKALIMVCEIDCTKEQKAQVQKRIDYYLENAKKYKYTVLGLPWMLFNKPFHQKRHYACSQFVARTLEDYGIRKFDKHYSIITPRDFYEMPNKKILYVGTIEGYIDKCDGYKRYIQ